MTQGSVRHLHPSGFRVMPWKNGGGTTTELIIEPLGSSLDTGFLWRLSMAEVGVSGPFSRFGGYDRTLLLLDGHGMKLDIEGREPMHLEGTLKPVSFSGDWITTGTLTNGPCRDFNVITQRSHCRHRVEVLRLEAQPVLLPGADVRFAFCVSGRVQVKPLGIELSAMELLRIEGAGETMSLSAREPSGAVLISIGIDIIRPR